ncbi:hypothetical protein [Streptomyces sp. 8N706]
MSGPERSVPPAATGSNDDGRTATAPAVTAAPLTARRHLAR